MENQKEPIKYIGQYKILSQYSYGSTSTVFKVQKTKNPNYSTNTTKHCQYYKDITEINLEKQPRKIDQTDQDQKKEFIFKEYSLQKMIDKQGKLLQIVKFDLFAQILIFLFIDHPGLVKAKSLLVSYETPSLNQNEPKKLKTLGIIMEFCEKGYITVLLDYINRTKSLRQNKYKIIKFYLAQIVDTLSFLNQQCNVLHRDLKVQNLIVNKQKQVKVIDYGTCKIKLNLLQKFYLYQDKQQILQIFNINTKCSLNQLFNLFQKNQKSRKNLIGSRHYISPQLVQKYKSDMQLIQQAYQKTDIWSFGVLVYKIFHQKFPFQGRNIRQTLDLILDQQTTYQIKQSLPQDIKQLITYCLKKDHSERASWKKIKQLNYFKEYKNQQIWQIQSPIVSILRLHRQQQNNRFKNIKKIFFSGILNVSQKDGTIKRRKIMIIQQYEKQFRTFLALKEKHLTVSYEKQLNFQTLSNMKLHMKQNNLQIQISKNHYENNLQTFNHKQFQQKLKFKKYEDQSNQQIINIKGDKQNLDSLIQALITTQQKSYFSNISTIGSQKELQQLNLN